MKTGLTDAEQAEALQELLERHASQISEHFNGSVQLMATHVFPRGGTKLFLAGDGDWYARQGMAAKYVQVAEARELALQLAAVLPNDGEKL